MPADARAVRLALAREPRPRGRSARLGWLIGLAALGVVIGLRSGDPAPAHERARTVAPSTAAEARTQRTPIEVSAPLRRNPLERGARAATIELEVVWQGSSFDGEVARSAVTAWLAQLTSRELIAAAGGAESGLHEALASALAGASGSSALAIDWKRLELR